MEYINSGSTLLNLCLTGEANKGYPFGRISNIVGDASTGKTLLAIEAATTLIKTNKDNKLKVVYYEAEAAFDQEYAAKLGMPVDKVDFIDGTTIENLYNTLCDVIADMDDDEKCLFIVDSLDALTTEEELSKDISKGSYMLSKPKKLSEIFRKLCSAIEQKNIHLMVISQVRENITSLPFTPKFTRAGGKALEFYSSHIIWLYEMKKIKKTKKNVEAVIGTMIKSKITKNKIAAPFRAAVFPLIYGYGVDDIGSMLDFLSDDNVPKEYKIKKSKNTYTFPNDLLNNVTRDNINERLTKDPSMYTWLIGTCKEVRDYYESLHEHNLPDKSNLINAQR